MAQTPRKIIGIVEDDAGIRRSTSRLLSGCGFDTETYDSAEAFLAASSKACCLVVDINLGKMTGIELALQLAERSIKIPIIFMTGLDSKSVRGQAMDAGAVAYLTKPFSVRRLIGAILKATGDARRLGAQQQSDLVELPDGRASNHTVQFAGGTLGEHCHVCAFFNSAEEEHRVLGPFIKDGLDAGEKAFHIVDPALRTDHMKWLSAEGINVEQAITTNQLEVRVWQEAYLRGDRFDQDAMLTMIDKALQSYATAGYSHTRAIGHMEWALLDKPGVGNLLEYESRLNYVLTKHHDPVICAYDLSKFNASVAMDVMRTHPMVIIGGVLQENPFFVPPDQFLLELRERGLSRKTAS